MGKDTLTIGRNTECDIVVGPEWNAVSGRHATIFVKGGVFYFTDHSTNGSIVGGRKVHKETVRITQGEKILLSGVCPVDWTAVTPRLMPTPAHPAPPAPGPKATERHFRTIGAAPADNEDTNIGTEGTAKGTGRGTTGWPGAGSRRASRGLVSEELEKWNWGAFLASWVWAPFNGAYWPLVVLLVAWIPYIGQVAQICLCSYLGLHGFRMAWRKNRAADFDSFMKRQRLWAWIGIAIFAGCVFANIVILRQTLLLF